MPEIGKKYFLCKSEIVFNHQPSGQRVRLSKGDILQTQALYQCPTCGRTYQVDPWQCYRENYFCVVRTPRPSLDHPSMLLSTLNPMEQRLPRSRKETSVSGGFWPPMERRSSWTSPVLTFLHLPTVNTTILRWQLTTKLFVSKEKFHVSNLLTKTTRDENFVHPFCYITWCNQLNQINICLHSMFAPLLAWLFSRKLQKLWVLDDSKKQNIIFKQNETISHNDDE